jgi:hypothetical protein
MHRPEHPFLSGWCESRAVGSKAFAERSTVSDRVTCWSALVSGLETLRVECAAVEWWMDTGVDGVACGDRSSGLAGSEPRNGPEDWNHQQTEYEAGRESVGRSPCPRYARHVQAKGAQRSERRPHLVAINVQFSSMCHCAIGTRNTDSLQRTKGNLGSSLHLLTVNTRWTRETTLTASGSPLQQRLYSLLRIRLNRLNLELQVPYLLPRFAKLTCKTGILLP